MQLGKGKGRELLEPASKSFWGLEGTLQHLPRRVGRHPGVEFGSFLYWLGTLQHPQRSVGVPPALYLACGLLRQGIPGLMAVRLRGRPEAVLMPMARMLHNRLSLRHLMQCILLRGVSGQALGPWQIRSLSVKFCSVTERLTGLTRVQLGGRESTEEESTGTPARNFRAGACCSMLRVLGA